MKLVQYLDIPLFESPSLLTYSPEFQKLDLILVARVCRARIASNPKIETFRSFSPLPPSAPNPLTFDVSYWEPNNYSSLSTRRMDQSQRSWVNRAGTRVLGLKTRADPTN